MTAVAQGAFLVRLEILSLTRMASSLKLVVSIGCIHLKPHTVISELYISSSEQPISIFV